MADDESERLKAVIRARNIHVDKEADVEDAIDEWIRSVGASAFEEGRKFGLQNEARRALELCEKWRPLLDMKAVSAENYEAFLIDLQAVFTEPPRQMSLTELREAAGVDGEWSIERAAGIADYGIDDFVVNERRGLFSISERRLLSAYRCTADQFNAARVESARRWNVERQERNEEAAS